ncbi:hypothetical protein ACP4OV_020799 [Aristida adscensionis]
MGHFHRTIVVFYLALLEAIILLVGIGVVEGLHVNSKDIMKTIKSECGDIIDCVDMYKRFPVLKVEDHNVKLKQAREHRKLLDRFAERNYIVPEQAWRRNGSCPEGTIPIRRSVISSNGEAANHTASPFRFSGHPNLTTGTLLDEAKTNVEIAAAHSVSGPYHGAYAAIPIWKSHVEPGEYSMSYLLIGASVDRHYQPIKGKEPPDTTYKIAVGAIIWPSVLGDDKPRFFVYYTNDDGVKSSCFNHDCDGFVQTSPNFALGGTFGDNYSQVGGQTYYIFVAIYRYPGTPVWRVSINEEEIGHFKTTTFPLGFFESLYNEMGGRVLNTRPGGRHTRTQMGSGMYASSGSKNAANIAFYMAINNNGGDQTDDPVNIVATSPKCYDAKDYGENQGRAGYDIGFGGPGGYDCDS